MGQTQPARVQIDLVPIPAIIVDRHKNVTLAGNIMKVNKIPFVITISGASKFGTAQVMEHQKMVTAVACVKSVRGMCARRGF